MSIVNTWCTPGDWCHTFTERRALRIEAQDARTYHLSVAFTPGAKRLPFLCKPCADSSGTTTHGARRPGRGTTGLPASAAMDRAVPQRLRAAGAGIPGAQESLY